jgi:hypothetical protein
MGAAQIMMSYFFRKKEWLQHRHLARGRHGVHSPFVYRLVDECLLVRSNYTLRQRLEDYFSGWQLHQQPVAAIQNLPLHKLSAYTVLILPDIHQSPQALHSWRELYARKEVVLSIDLFYYGLLFFHPDFKEKQHFVLKCFN